jgi:lysophospholipase L1-like esterase
MGDRSVLCYGDSNTYGFDPASGGRFPPGVRWPGVLATELGAGWRVIEEGLSGRTTVHDDPFLPHCNGLEHLLPCLYSHAPLDVVVLFLGQNDLKPRFRLPAIDVARGVAMLVQSILDSGAGLESGPPHVLVLGMPRLGRFDETDEQFEGVAARAERLPRLLRQQADELGVEFLDLAPVTAFSDLDGFHLEAPGHAAVGRAVAQIVRSMV